MCQDHFLLSAVLTALEGSSSDAWITANITDSIRGYKSFFWAVQTSIFERAYFDYLPNNNATDDLCVVLADALIIFIVRISPS